MVEETGLALQSAIPLTDLPVVAVEMLGRSARYQPRTVETPDGVRVAVQDWLPMLRSDGGRDILFLHGFSQSHLCWLKQVCGPLGETHRLVTYDLRGHGDSDKPVSADAYRSSLGWAQELDAVIAGLGLDNPIIVAWSYAGRVVFDYLGHFGDSAIDGVVLVAATSIADPEYLGPATPALRRMATATTLVENIAATRHLLEICSVTPLPPEELAFMLAYNMIAPVAVRAAMGGREAAYTPILAALNCPLLAIHGACDVINLPAMAHFSASGARNGRAVIYEATGHLPFWEQPERFDADLDEFIARCRRRTNR